MKVSTPSRSLKASADRSTSIGAGAPSGVAAGFRPNRFSTGTPNPAFRRIEIAVTESARPDYVIARLVGYVGQSAQK